MMSQSEIEGILDLDRALDEILLPEVPDNEFYTIFRCPICGADSWSFPGRGYRQCVNCGYMW